MSSPQTTLSARQLVSWLLIATVLQVGVSFGQGNILWDESHGPEALYDLDGRYSDLADYLANAEYSIESGEEYLDSHGLWDIDILVLSIMSNYDEPYSHAEIDRVRSFVTGGGGLIVLSEGGDNNPENQAELLESFGLINAVSDFIDDLEAFDDHELFDGVEWLHVSSGGAVGVTEDEGGLIIAYDINEEPVIALNLEFGGKVLLIGSASIWRDRNLDDADNLVFAGNCFEFVDRVRSGEIEVQGEGRQIFLPVEGIWTDTIRIRNTGRGLLEYGTDIADLDGWMQADILWDVLEPDSVGSIVISFETLDLPPDSVVTGSVFIRHNTPDAESVELVYQMTVLNDEPTYFDPPPSTGADHSLLIEDFSVANEAARPGVEVGVFNHEGMCYGAVVFTGDRLGLAARGDNPLTDEIDGFEDGDDFFFRLYDPWDDIETSATPIYNRGPDRFSVDALTMLDLHGSSDSALQIELNPYTNLISFNLNPFNPNVENIFADLIEDDLLISVKDGRGRFWFTEYDFSNLENWEIPTTYLVRVADTTRLIIQGTVVDATTPLPLRRGWNTIPFLPQGEQPTEAALETVWEDLHLVKDEIGIFSIPDWDYYGLDTMSPGEGYRIRMHATDTLVYPEQVEEQRSPQNSADKQLLSSAHNMSLLITDVLLSRQVRVVSSAGSVLCQGKAASTGMVGLAVPGDDPDTPSREGLSDGEDFDVQILTGDDWEFLELTWLEGEAEYHDDELTVGKVTGSWLTPASHRIIEFYPNPFNDRVQIQFNWDIVGNVSLNIYDITGRLIEASQLIVGASTDSKISLNAEGWPAGILIVELIHENRRSTFKTVHLP